MTRKIESGNNTLTSSRAAASLRHLRTQIDKLDLQILRLVNDRATVASEIGKLKDDQGGEVFSPARRRSFKTYCSRARARSIRVRCERSIGNS